MKTNKFAALAAIKAFYEMGNDFMEIFASFVLQVLSITPMSIETIQEKIKDKFDIHIPLDVLKTINKRLKKHTYISYDNFQSVRLESKGHIKKEENKMDLDNKQRENNALFRSLQKFVNKNINKEVNKDRIKEKLGLFIQTNSYAASFLLSGEQSELRSDNELTNCIAEYFVKTEKDDPRNFERLKSLVYGEIISSVLIKRIFQKEAKFEKIDIYLDTNIVFNLMDLGNELLNKSAKELVNTIKDIGFNLKIFTFTKDEIIYKLRSYLSEYDFYTEEIEINSIYFRLKQNNFSKQDVVLLIEKIESELKKIDISIDYSFDLEELIKGKQNILLDLANFKGREIYSYPVKHDVAAIEAIQRMRNGRKISLIEKSKSIFLTADMRLCIFNFNKYKHINQTVPEVIFRSDLASIFWLKYPELNSNLLIHNLIAGNAKRSLINENLWNIFIDELKKQRVRGDIDADDINILISSNETKNILHRIQSDEQGRDSIKLFINEEIKKRKRNENKRNKENIKLKQENNSLKKLIKQHQNNKIKETEKTNKKIEVICRKKSCLLINIILLAIGIISLSSIGYLIFRNGIMKYYEWVGVVMALLLIPSLIFSLIKRKRVRILDFIIKFIIRIENKKIEKCIEKKKRILGDKDKVC